MGCEEEISKTMRRYGSENDDQKGTGVRPYLVEILRKLGRDQEVGGDCPCGGGQPERIDRVSRRKDGRGAGWFYPGTWKVDWPGDGTLFFGCD